MVILVHTWLVETDTTISGHFLWAEMEVILIIHFYPPIYAHGRSLRHILDKITKWHFLRASNEVIWPPKNLNSIHVLKSAILAILPEIGQSARFGLPCESSPPFPIIENDRICLPIKNELKLPSEAMPGLFPFRIRSRQCVSTSLIE